MATFDDHKNLAIGYVWAAPSPALSGTSITLSPGAVANFPTAPFNCTVYPSDQVPTVANAEIIRVTNIAGDVLTIVRAQEGTTAKAIRIGFAVANTVTVKDLTDIENAVNAIASSIGSFGIQSISAGASVASGPTLVFSNSNGVSFGASNNTITAQFSGGGGAAVSAGANSQSTGTVVFSNSNGVTFGLSNNGVLTASFSNAQSTQPVAASASNGSFAFSTLGFSNANGVTFGTSAGSIITASIPAGVAAGSVSAGTSSMSLGQVIFSNSNNITFGLDNGTITASFSGAGQSNQPVAASASNGSFLFSTLGFSNANGVTFGTSAGSIVTASISTASVAGEKTLSFYEPIPLINISFSTLGQNTIYFDHIALPANVSALSFNRLMSFQALGVSSNAATTGQAGFTKALGIYTRSVTDSAASNFSNSSNIVLMFSSQNTISAFLSASSSSVNLSYGWGTGSTNGSSSDTFSTLGNNFQPTNLIGQVLDYIGFATSLSVGEYWIAQFNSSSSAGLVRADSLIRVSNVVQTLLANGSWHDFGVASNSSVKPIPGVGIYSVTSAQFPTSLGLTEISNQSLHRRYFQFAA